MAADSPDLALLKANLGYTAGTTPASLAVLASARKALNQNRLANTRRSSC